MSADIYRPERDVSDQYIETVTKWIQSSGDVFIVMRYLRAAGAKDYAFARTADDFRQLLDVLPVGTDVIVFRDPQLPLRGVVDDDFLVAAQSLIPDGDAYLFVRMDPLSTGDIRAFGEMGGSHAELNDDLQYHPGKEVAIGPCPRFIEADHEAMISASIGGIDGPR